jgi:hypothetical protein
MPACIEKWDRESLRRSGRKLSIPTGTKQSTLKRVELPFPALSWKCLHAFEERRELGGSPELRNGVELLER